MTKKELAERLEVLERRVDLHTRRLQDPTRMITALHNTAATQNSGRLQRLTLEELRVVRKMGEEAQEEINHRIGRTF